MIDRTKRNELISLLEKYQKLGYYSRFSVENMLNGSTNILLFEPNYNVNSIFELLEFLRKNGFYLWSINTRYVTYTDDTSD